MFGNFITATLAAVVAAATLLGSGQARALDATWTGGTQTIDYNVGICFGKVERFSGLYIVDLRRPPGNISSLVAYPNGGLYGGSGGNTFTLQTGTNTINAAFLETCLGATSGSVTNVQQAGGTDTRDNTPYYGYSFEYDGKRCEFAWSGLTNTQPIVTDTCVRPANVAPTANAGPDQTVASASAPVTLDGSSSSDPDAGQTITYAWTQTAGPAVTLSSTTAASPTFTAPTLPANDPDATLTFQLIVTDNLNLASVSDTVTITVVSGPSVALSGGPAAITGTDPFNVTATFTKPVTGFSSLANDVIATNGSVTAISGGPAIYTLTITPTGTGVVSITIPSAAAQDDVGNANRASNTLEIGTQTSEITEEQIAGFMLGRANNLASNQPGLIRFLDGTGCGNFDANTAEATGSISGCVSNQNIWAEVTSSWGGGNSYTLGTLGAHTSVNPDLIVGGMLQLDHTEDDLNNASGTGWMVGPYFAARMAKQPLFFEGRLLYGESSNSITPSGTYSDNFSTERWLAQLKVQGEIATERVTWLPSLGIIHTTDGQRAYADSLGNTISGQNISLTQVNSGIGFRLPLDVAKGDLQLTGGLDAIYSVVHDGNADFEGLRGKIKLGLDWNYGSGTTLRFATFYDGIGLNHESYGVDLGINIRF
jgi:hypothetical protein